MNFLIICDAVKKYINEEQAERIATMVHNFKRDNRESGYYIIFVNSVVEAEDSDFDIDLHPSIVGTEEAELPSAILQCIRPDNTSLSWRKRLSFFKGGNPCVWEIMNDIYLDLQKRGSDIESASLLFCSTNEVANDYAAKDFAEKMKGWSDPAKEINIIHLTEG